MDGRCNSSYIKKHGETMTTINTIEDFKKHYNKLFYVYNGSKYITAHLVEDGSVCIIAWRFKPSYVYSRKEWRRKLIANINIHSAKVGQVINYNIDKWHQDFVFSKAIIYSVIESENDYIMRNDLKNIEYLPF